MLMERIKQQLDEIKKHLPKQTKKMVLIVAGAGVLSLGVWYMDREAAAESVGFVSREDIGGSTTSQSFSFFFDSEEGEEQEVALSVSPTLRSQEEALALLEEAVASWESVYLGENDSANEVRLDLSLPESLCDGAVSVSWDSSNANVLDSDGCIISDGLDEEGTLVELTVKFVCTEATRIEVYTLCVLPPMEGSQAWLLQELSKAVTKAEEESRYEAGFALPESIASVAVLWQEERSYRWAMILLLGIVLAVGLELQQRQQEKEKEQQRKEQLLWEYPQMVNQVSVLLDGGMPMRRVWERMLSAEGAKKKEALYLEEMQLTFREMREGRGEREAYERFGNRIGLLPYRRFSSILSQNLSKGTRNLQELLRQEAQEALEMRRNQARKRGEEAGTKLLFPMLVMLVLILIVLLLPAAGNF